MAFRRSTTDAISNIPVTDDSLGGRLKLAITRSRLAFGDLSWGMAFEGFTLISGLLTFGILAKQLGTTSYGIYAGIAGLVASVNVLLASWLGLWVLESVVRRGRPALAMTRAALTMGVAALVIAGVTLYPLSRLLLPDVPRHVLGAFLLAEVTASGFSGSIAAGIQAIRGFAVAARYRLIPLLGRLATLMTLFLTHHISLKSVGYGFLVSQAVCACIMAVIGQRIIEGAMYPGGLKTTYVKEGLPYSATLITFAIQEDFDKTLLVRFGFANDAGIYALAYKIVQIALLPLRTFVGSTHQNFLVPSENPEHTQLHRAKKLSRVGLAYSAVVVIGLEALASFVPDVLGDKYQGSVTIIRVLAPLVAFRSVSWFPLNALMGLGLHRKRVTVLASSSILNVVLNLILIPRYSWRGAVISTFAAEAIFVALSWSFLLQRVRAADEEAAELVTVGGSS